MIGPSGNVRDYLACGVTDMRRGIDGLSTLVETVIKEAPGSGAIFGFRGKARRPDQASMVGLPRVLPILQDSRARVLSLADGERWCCASDAGSVVDAC